MRWIHKKDDQILFMFSLLKLPPSSQTCDQHVADKLYEIKNTDTGMRVWDVASF